MVGRLPRLSLAAVLAGLPLSAAFAQATAPAPAPASPDAGASAAPKNATPSDADVLLFLFQKKGLISDQDVRDAHEALASRTNGLAPSMSPWHISSAVKSLEIFGDARFRYEYRGVENAVGAAPDTYYRERFRYALRLGVRGELSEDFNFGVRLETSSNPRSPWVTFGNNTTAGSVTPSDKNAAGIYLGQVYLNWRPDAWYEMTVGRMPMPLFTTSMVWDSDINPEGAFEKFKYSSGGVDWFAQAGQFDYQGPSSATAPLSSDTFILAWQLGAKVKLDPDMSFTIAPAFYNYTGMGTSGNGLNLPFVGQGNTNNVNVGVPGATAANLAAFNQNGINNLQIGEVPFEYTFQVVRGPLGPVQVRAFGDVARNFAGNARAEAAYKANPAAFPGLSGPVRQQDMAYQAGIGVGSAGATYAPNKGLVYGSAARKDTWELRAYWQHVEQYALDVNLLDSDFFEGRSNLQGVYAAFAYSFTDAVIGTIRYGYASRIRNTLGTGGNNLDVPGINPIRNYNLVQFDLTLRL